jgi:hypothetical protein
MRIGLNPQVLIAVALSTALAVSLSGSAWAQASDATAGNANGSGMPAIQHQGDVAYVSGGVGSDESHALQRARSQWPLDLNFTGSGSDFLADVQVRILDTNNAEVLNATSNGPYMLVRLHPGHYTVHASYKGNDQSKAVTVPAKGSARSTFHWASQ